MMMDGPDRGETVDPRVAAQLDAADARPEAPAERAPGPDAMSRVIEEHAAATAQADPADLTSGEES